MSSMIGHNQPPVDVRAKELAAAAENWLAKVPKIVSEEGAGRCKDFLGQVNSEIKLLEAARKAEKQPHIDAGKQVDAKYAAPKTILENAKKLIEPKLRAWLIEAENKRREEAAHKAELARVAAEEAKAKAQEAAKAQTVASHVDAEAASKAAKDAVKAAEAEERKTAQVRGEVTGKASSLRSRKVAVLDHVGDALAHYRNHPDLVELVTKLANAELRHGAERVPGFRVEVKQIAV